MAQDRNKAIDSATEFLRHCLDNSPKYTGEITFEFYGGELRKKTKHQEYFERSTSPEAQRS